MVFYIRLKRSCFRQICIPSVTFSFCELLLVYFLLFNYIRKWKISHQSHGMMFLSLNMIKREKIKNGNDELGSLHQEHLQMFPLTSRQLTDLVAPSKTFASLPISAIQERHFISTPPVKR